MSKRHMINWWALSSGWVQQSQYSGLVALWKLNGDTWDYSGNDFNANKSANVTFTTGKLESQAALFDGTTDFIVAAHNADLSFGTGGTDLPFGFEAWIYPTASNFGAIITKGIGANDRQWSVYKEGTNKISLLLYSNGSATNNYLYGTSSGTVTLNQWNFIQCTYDGTKAISGIKIWINGVSQSITNSSIGSYVQMGSIDSQYYIGNAQESGSNYFRGRIEYAAIFNRELTQTDADNRYNSGNGLAYNASPTALFFDDYYESTLRVIATNGNYVFASDVTTGGTNLKWSSNNGDTWTDYNWGTQWSAGVVYDKTVDFGYLFNNGTLIFSCGNKLYRSTDGLSTAPVEITPKNMDGSDYVVHTPANASYPGTYFQILCLDKEHQTLSNGTEILVWSNYCNVITNNMGVAPTNVYYTIDRGATVKVLYKFGQNPNYRDNGTPGGSNSTGTLLGDSGNAIYCRHSHGTFRYGSTMEWYTVTGDNPFEAHWIKHTYNENLDTWSNSQVSGITAGSLWQSAGLGFYGTDVYWSSDVGDGSVDGIYKTSVANIGSSSTKLHTIYEEGYDIVVDQSTRKIVLLIFDSGFQNVIMQARNLAATDYAYFRMAGVNSTTIYNGKIFPKNANGYYKLNIGEWWTQPQKTIYFKLK